MRLEVDGLQILTKLCNNAISKEVLHLFVASAQIIIYFSYFESWLPQLDGDESLWGIVFSSRGVRRRELFVFVS